MAASAAHRVYTGGLTYDKKLIPEWNLLTALVQGAWRAAARRYRWQANERQRNPMYANGVMGWEVKCDCGNTWWVAMQSLVAGLTRSCGCLYKDRSSRRK